MSLIYYITNYATKDDVSPWQIVAKAALVRHSNEKARVAEPPTATDLRLREKGMGNFALRCFNALSHDREISGVQVASVLLQLPTYYTVNYSFTRINLWWLRRYVRAVIHSDNLDSSRSSELVAEEPCIYETGDTAPVSIFDNYKWRGPHLAPLALFEYCMLVKTKNIRGAIADDADFDSNHPRYTTHVQRLARSPSQVATVTFNGQLTEFQAAEDAVPGGHPKKTAIINDMSEILLGLFVPWAHLVNLFRRYATQRDTWIHGRPLNQLSHFTFELLQETSNCSGSPKKTARLMQNYGSPQTVPLTHFTTMSMNSSPQLSVLIAMMRMNPFTCKMRLLMRRH